MIRNVDITRNRSYGRILNNVKYLYIINCIDINTGTGVSLDLSPMAYRSIRWFALLLVLRYFLLDYKWFVDNHFEILLINFNFSFISIFLFIYWIYFSFPLPSFLIKRASDYCDQSKFIWFQFYWMKFELFFFNIIKSIFSLDFFFFLSTNILIKDNIRHANDTFHGHVVHVTRY